jgi:hypothetical protein
MHVTGEIVRVTESNFKPIFAGVVAEMQGLYGAFSFSERLFQKIWRRGDYDGAALRTEDGCTIKVLHPGRWNHLGGPDFAGACLLIDGREVTGDVELHLHAKDWAAHGHAADHAYDNVALHVVLFPCAETSTCGAAGRKIPILCLLPLLHHGLEEYAADDAMEQLAGRPLHYAQEILGGFGNEELNTILRAHASARWTDKVRFARERIARLGWEGACHHAALEILGYRFNRAPMLSAASAFPLAEWLAGRINPACVFEELSERWSLHGVRPFNHPRLRLQQYAAWCVARPDWPERLRRNVSFRELAANEMVAVMPVGKWRREADLTKRRAQIREEVCAGALSGSRFDNLVGDGFLPLLAAETGLVLEPAWTGWFAGDAPEMAVQVLRKLGVFSGRACPVSYGPVQGVLGWLLAHEAHLQTKAASVTGAGLDKILPQELP